jgi:hypothetical protein
MRNSLHDSLQDRGTVSAHPEKHREYSLHDSLYCKGGRGAACVLQCNELPPKSGARDDPFVFFYWLRSTGYWLLL